MTLGTAPTRSTALDYRRITDRISPLNFLRSCRLGSAVAGSANKAVPRRLQPLSYPSGDSPHRLNSLYQALSSRRGHKNRHGKSCIDASGNNDVVPNSMNRGEGFQSCDNHLRYPRPSDEAEIAKRRDGSPYFSTSGLHDAERGRALVLADTSCLHATRRGRHEETLLIRVSSGPSDRPST